MNQETHNRYFQHIDYNINTNLQWPEWVGEDASIYERAKSPQYEERIHNLLTTRCHHVSSLDELFQPLPPASTSADPHSPRYVNLDVYCIWIDVDPSPDGPHPPFEHVSTYFGIWHEHRRGCHRGLHEFYWTPRRDGKAQGNRQVYIMLLNVRETDGRSESTYRQYKPNEIRPISPIAFRR